MQDARMPVDRNNPFFLANEIEKMILLSVKFFTYIRDFALIKKCFACVLFSLFCHKMLL